MSFTLEKDFSIEVNGSEWEDLISSCTMNKSKKLLLPPTWSNLVAKFLSNRIPHCSINFKRHKVYASGSNFVAKFWFRCGIEGCSLDGTAILDKYMVLHVNNKYTDLKHVKGKRKSFCSRFVKGEDRIKLGESVNGLSFPSKEYHKRLADLDETYFQAGNLKDIPMSKNVLKQCGYEYRQSTLEDKDVVQSILILKEKYISELESRTIPGFIQFFSLQPFTLALWTESDIECFHKMSTNHSLLVDATGSISTKLSNKEIFYFAVISYDRSVQTEPVAHIEILTELSTTNTLKFILMRFLEDEMKRYNYTTHSVPLLCTTDVSWPIIKSLIGVFNNESVEEYIGRSFVIVSGRATSNELPINKLKTFVHISLCHVMKAFSNKVNKCFKKDKNFIKFALSLLANSFDYQDILEICSNLFKVLLSKFSSDCVDAKSYLDKKNSIRYRIL